MSNDKYFIRNRIHIKPLNLVPYYIPDEPLVADNQTNLGIDNKRTGIQVNKDGHLVTTSGRVVRPPIFFIKFNKLQSYLYV